MRIRILPSLIPILLTVAPVQQQQASRLALSPVYDRAYAEQTYSDSGAPFLIQVNDIFFRRSASYPRGETVADGTFLFINIDIFNNSDRALQIPRFTLQDFRGNAYLTAIRARRSRNAILGGELLSPGGGKRGYLIFDVPSLSESESLPRRYKLLIADSPQAIDVNVYKTVD
jgi:hypothetical protein